MNYLYKYNRKSKTKLFVSHFCLQNHRRKLGGEGATAPSKNLTGQCPLNVLQKYVFENYY
jgi:hypothetical protein